MVSARTEGLSRWQDMAKLIDDAAFAVKRALKVHNENDCFLHLS